MKTWKGYSVLDLVLLLLGVCSVVVVSFFIGFKWYVLIQSLLFIFMVFTQAKGKIITLFIGIVTFLFYIIISYSQKLYGEAMVYAIFLLPLYIYGVIHWLKHKDLNNVVRVRGNLTGKEWTLMIEVLVIISIGSFFLLKALETSQLIVSTLSFVSMLPAVYLLARRCKWNQIAFLINDIFLVILWIRLAVSGNTTFIPMVICFLFQTIYDIYGLFEWFKLENKQNKNIS